MTPLMLFQQVLALLTRDIDYKPSNYFAVWRHNMLQGAMLML